jgi:hypothetical protein
MAALNLAEFHRFHQSHRKNDGESSADEIANQGGLLVLLDVVPFGTTGDP